MKKRLLALVMMATLVMGMTACGSKDTSGSLADGTSAAEELTTAVEIESESQVEEVVLGETTAATEDDYEYVKSKGKLVIGITIYEPMNYNDENNNLVGFDTEYAQAVCEKLGVEPEFVIINWDTKVFELESKNIDCIWNGMTITEELKQSIDFSNAYIKNMQVPVIKKNNAEKYVDTASLKGCVISAEAGSAGEIAIKADAELSQATYVPVAKQTDALMEVKAGTSDAAVLDYVLAAAMVGEGTDYADLCMIDGVELSVEEYGIGFRKGSTLTEKVNAATDELIADGTLAALAEKYGLSLQLIANQK